MSGIFGHRHKSEEQYDDAPPPQSDYGYGDDKPSSDYGYDKPSGYGGNQPSSGYGDDQPSYGGDGYDKPAYGRGRNDQYSDQTDYTSNQSTYATDGGYVDNTTTDYSQSTYDDEEKAKKEEQSSKHKEHLGELGTVAAGGYALYERYEAKKDPEHAGRHRIEEEVAAVAAVGSGGYAFHEHHEKKQAEDEYKQDEEAEGQKKHHFF